MKIEVLYVPNCPNHAVALERLREILAGESLEAHLNEVLVSSTAMAQSLRFPGSPTIRINGRDIEPQEEETASFGLMCRLYADGNGAPSHQKLRDAIRRARDLGV
jgi:hypothetical protein